MAENNIVETYRLLYDRFGTQNWWPADTPFEVMVGAVLTQNTSWHNVVKALDNLKMASLLSYTALSGMSVEDIADRIRPSGYYNVKARRLKNLLVMVEEKYNGELALFFQEDMWVARDNLLAVAGVGPETADSILLYACNAPIFVIDGYTHRIFSRHNMVEEESDYQTMQELFMDSLPEDTQLYNEYHALIVKTATTYCKKKNPLCDQCPLRGLNL